MNNWTDHKVRKTKDYIYFYILVLYMNRVMFFVAARSILNETIAGQINTFINLILVIYTAISIIREHFPLDIIVIVYLYFLSLMITVILNPILVEIAKDAGKRFIQCLIGYYIFSRYKGHGIFLYRRFLNINAVLIVLYCIMMIRYGNINHTNNSDYFPISYGIVLQTSLLLISINDNILYALAGMAGSALILFAGARGAFVCIASAVTIYVLLSVNKSESTARRLLLITVTLVIAIMLVSNVDSFIDMLYKYMPNSRSLKLFSYEATVDNNRLTLWRRIINEILDDPLRYRGVLADRIVGGQVYISLGVQQGTYAHNMVLEILYQHGLLLGSMIIIALVSLTISAFIPFLTNAGNEFDCRLLISLFSSSIVGLMISNSYLINWFFWSYIGFSLRSVLSTQNNNRECLGDNINSTGDDYDSYESHARRLLGRR